MVKQQKGMFLPHTTVNQPVIFVHGINENANDMGNTLFVPIYRELQNDFGKIQTFEYIDDRAFGQSSLSSCPINYKFSQYKYSLCVSQSSVLDNAIQLAKDITSLFNSANHKVTLIGYSMGAAIIRTALAGCQQNVTCQAVLGSKIAERVNNVFFINGVQQGSWMAQNKKGKNIPAAVSLLQTIKAPLAKPLWGLYVNADAVKDMEPQSINIVSHNSVVPAKNIHYFNFYGDIKLSLKINSGIYPTTIHIDIGDGVVLPGTDNPQDKSFWGGARFCLQCEGKNFSQIDTNTTYRQWPLTTEKSIDLEGLCTPSSIIQHGCSLGSLFDLVARTPQFHLSIRSKASLDGTDIQVADTTGISGSKTTSIAKEIALQLQAQQNVYVNSQDGNIYALNASNGKTLWKYSTGSQGIGQLQVADGVVYFIIDEDINTNPNATSTMYALDAQNGTLLRRFKLPYFTLEGSASIPPFTVANGAIYFSSPGMAFAINSTDGTMLWKYSWFGRGASDPVVVNNIVYYVTGTGVIYAFKSSDGTVLWRYDLGPDAVAKGSIMGTYPTPAIMNNTLYVVGWLADNVYAISLQTHTLQWHIHITGEQTEALYVSNGTIFVKTSAPESIYALRINDGSQLWSKHNLSLQLADSDTLYSLGVSTDGSYTNVLYALRFSDGTTIWNIQVGGSGSFFRYIAAALNTIFVMSDTNLTALSTNDRGVLWQIPLSGYMVGP